MRRTLAALALASLLLIPGTVQASEECPNPERPIHYLPYCLTEAEYVALTAPPPPPVVPGPVYGPLVEQWRPLVVKYWPADRVSWALAIIECESGGAWWADNPYSTARGLFQFLRSTWNRGPAPALGLPSYDSGAPYNGEWNIQAAAWLFANWGGESQWQCKA